MKIAVVGSREYQNMDAVKRFINSLPQDTIVVSGGARGVDRVAQDAATERGLQVIVFPADWDSYGKLAGYRRNIDIVKASDAVIAFWDFKSRGTKLTIDIAKDYYKELEIVGEDGVFDVSDWNLKKIGEADGE